MLRSPCSLRRGVRRRPLARPSVTEGADKPLKYPHMFAAAGLVIVNKIDLLPYVDFDLQVCSGHARSINPDVQILPVSATTGEGIQAWYNWIDGHAN